MGLHDLLANEEAKEAASRVVFYAMAGICVFTIVYPWKLRDRVSRMMAHVPLLLVPLYWVYDALTSDGSLQLDMFAIVPMTGFSLAFYIGKLVVWSSQARCKRGEDTHG